MYCVKWGKGRDSKRVEMKLTGEATSPQHVLGDSFGIAHFGGYLSVEVMKEKVGC
jgi:hypothetical protein